MRSTRTASQLLPKSCDPLGDEHSVYTAVDGTRPTKIHVTIDFIETFLCRSVSLVVKVPCCSFDSFSHDELIS